MESEPRALHALAAALAWERDATCLAAGRETARTLGVRVEAASSSSK